MTTGALIFAFNNTHTDYVRMARWCARNVQQHLGIPVALVTNDTSVMVDNDFAHVIVSQAQNGGGRWFSDYQTHVPWYNAGRPDAYELSPWDNTLVLDSDFVVNSNALKLLFDTDKDFLCFRHCANATDPDQLLLPSFGKFNMPMWWATVMWFRRSHTAQYIFESMQMIRNNWNHYRDLYGISEDTFRNDYALSIAIGIVSGHTWRADEIGWPMLATLPEHDLKLNCIGAQQYWNVRYVNTEGKDRCLGFTGLDFHAMGKKSLEANIVQ